MQIAYWNPNKFDETFEKVAMSKLVEAGELIAEKARHYVHIGTISRPVYRSGDYPGLPWTSRDAGRLKKSIRVSRKKTESGKAFSRKRNVRIIAGHYKAYYPYWVEFGSSTIKRKKNRKARKPTARNIEFGYSRIPAHPFMRPAFYSAIPEIQSMIRGTVIGAK